LGYRSALYLICCLPAVTWSATPDTWIPARWPGGPLEVERRAAAKTLPSDAALRENIANWYDPATLDLLEGSPINCLLVTWSAGNNSDFERRQREVLKVYIDHARQRRIAILGLVYPGGDPSKIAVSAAEARLDGLVLEGRFPEGFTRQVTTALLSANPLAVVIRIGENAASVRTADAPVPAVEGVSPNARNLADMGIRAAPSSEPWIQSNMWLVRSFRRSASWRPVWISYEPDHGTAADYERSVADAAVAGGRWIVALDDGLRSKLRRNDASAVDTWRRLGACLRFAEQNAEWRSFGPYARLGFILDTASRDQDLQDEYLKLVARRQAPYRVIVRSKLESGSLEGLRAVLATALDPPTGPERKLLGAFAEGGGVVVVGPSWGDAPKDRTFAEVPAGKGRIVVYRDPDPETVARDMKELSVDEAGMMAFNVPSVLTYASAGIDGKRVLVQLLNYSDYPATAITIRLAGTFKTARLLQPNAAPSTLSISAAEGKTDVAIPKLSLWGGVLLE
jgi:hypothetical protein